MEISAQSLKSTQNACTHIRSNIVPKLCLICSSEDSWWWSSGLFSWCYKHNQAKFLCWRLLKIYEHRGTSSVLYNRVSRQLIEVCDKGGFRLNKYISNNHTLLSAIPEENRAKGIKQLDLSRGQLPLESALDVPLNTESDIFTCNIEIKPHSVTRRGILSI